MTRVLLAACLSWFAVTAIAAAQEAKPADLNAKPKLNFQDHVQLIFREHCNSCHSADQAKGGLALDSFAATMRGGASGEVVFAGDLESSRLWALVAHLETPKMPPEQDKLPEAKLNLIKQWILDGALENSGSKAKAAPKTNLELKANAGSGKPSGPPPMPEGITREPFVVTPRPGAITALAASPWAPLIAVGGQKQVLLYHSETGDPLGVLPFPEGIPHVIKFSRNGSVLLVGGGRNGASGKVVLFEVKSGKRLAEVGDELDTVLAADVNDDLTIVALGGPRKSLKLLYVADGSEVCPPIRKHTDWIYAIEFSPDGVLLATSDRSGGLVVWEGDTGREFHNLVGHKAGVTDVSWRDDGNVLASSSEDGTVKLWEMDNGKEIKSFPAAEGTGVTSVKMAHDGTLVTAGRNKKLGLWAPDGRAIRQYTGFADITLEAAISHDGKFLLAGDLQGNVRLYTVESDKLVAELSANPPTLEVAVVQETERLAVAEKALSDAQAAEQGAQAKLAQIKAGQDAFAQGTTALQQAEAARTEAEKKFNEASAQAKQAADQATAQRAAADKLKGPAEAAEKNALAKQDAAQKLAADAAADPAAQAKAKSEADQAAQEAAKQKQGLQAAQQQAETAAKQAAERAKTRMDLEAAKNQAVAKVDELKKALPGLKANADRLTAEKAAADKALAERAAARQGAQAEVERQKSRVERAKADKAASEKIRTAQAAN